MYELNGLISSENAFWKLPSIKFQKFHSNPKKVDGYILEYAAAGSALWKRLNVKQVSLMRYPVTGLEEGQAYFFRVRAVNRWGKTLFHE